MVHAICDNALLLALSESTRAIGLEHIELTCLDLQLPTPPYRRPGPLAAPPPVETVADTHTNEVPHLVRKAAVGGSPVEPPHEPTYEQAADPAHPNTSAPSNPSLWKKWRGLL